MSSELRENRTPFDPCGVIREVEKPAHEIVRWRDVFSCVFEAYWWFRSGWAVL